MALRSRVREQPNPLHVRCRRVKGGLFQARVWCGYGHGFVNLGLYRSAREARRVVAECLRRANPVTPLTLWRAALSLPESFGVRPGLLPKHVFANPDGTFGARVAGPSGKVELGPFPGPEAAHEAAAAADRPPPPPRKRKPQKSKGDRPTRRERTPNPPRIRRMATMPSPTEVAAKATLKRSQLLDAIDADALARAVGGVLKRAADGDVKAFAAIVDKLGDAARQDGPPSPPPSISVNTHTQVSVGSPDDTRRQLAELLDESGSMLVATAAASIGVTAKELTALATHAWFRVRDGKVHLTPTGRQNALDS